MDARTAVVHIHQHLVVTRDGGRVLDHLQLVGGGAHAHGVLQ